MVHYNYIFIIFGYTESCESPNKTFDNENIIVY